MIAQNLIDFDKEWSTLMAKKPEEFESPSALEDFYVSTAEFPAGFMTQYQPSMIVGRDIHQSLATGFPIGKRFKSARVARVADGNDVHLGHHHRADGRWRVYAFADAARPGEPSALADWAEWMANSPESPARPVHARRRRIPTACSTSRSSTSSATARSTSARCRRCSCREVGPFGLTDYEKVYAVDPGRGHLRAARHRPRRGCVVVVRPDQYVANVLPLTATAELADVLRAVPAAGDRARRSRG